MMAMSIKKRAGEIVESQNARKRGSLEFIALNLSIILESQIVAGQILGISRKWGVGLLFASLSAGTNRSCYGAG